MLLGQSAAMCSLRERIARIAPSQASVMITGPSGSGKERVARALHAASDRAKGPFVAINCGAIPRDLLESELFGHEKGSFTGAHATRAGRFEEANGGTLFLDEIGDMPHDMQVKLLRVLEERQVQRVGSGTAIAVDVRILSATHRNLEEAVAEQRFREDLFYRLAVLPIELPSLAERLEDVPLLIEHFLSGLSIGLPGPEFAPAALRRLQEHPWPGNIRELRNVVERAVILHPGERLGSAEAEALLVSPLVRTAPAAPRLPCATLPTAGAAHPVPPDATDLPATGIDLRAVLSDLESRYIDAALSRADGVVADAARLLGLRRTTLIEKMRRYA